MYLYTEIVGMDGFSIPYMNFSSGMGRLISCLTLNLSEDPKVLSTTAMKTTIQHCVKVTGLNFGMVAFGF